MATVKVVGFHETTLRLRLKSDRMFSSLERCRLVFTIGQEQIVDHCEDLVRMFYAISLICLRFLSRVIYQS